jgi:dTDP-glucose 4,6-dehydratase
VRYLITGGAGFIGSALVRHVLQERPDVEVVTLDALTYAGHLDNLEGVLGDPRHRFVEGDICDGALVRPLFDDVDVVIHLAAESHVDRSILSDQPFVRTNVMGTATLLAAALDAGISRFLHVSTDEVYGSLPWVDPGDSTDESRPAARFTEVTPLAPRSPYAASKAAGDHLAMAYHVTHGLDVVVTRCSNNYGPRQFPEKLIPLMVQRALEDLPLPLYGDGLNVRDWIHVHDHCRGLLAAVDQGEAGRIYNLGGGAERTNLDVVRSILSLLGKPQSLIEFVEDRPGHDRRYAIDHARATDELGWSPRVSFEEGLEATVRWYRSHEAWVRAVTSR